MENSIKNSTIESTLPKYLEFKIFEIFKNRLVQFIAPHCREGSKEDVYKHIFLCPSQEGKLRNFQLKGVLSPFVCLWRTSAISWNDQFRARSVLSRDFAYKDKEGNPRSESGFLYDLTFDMELFSSSYYKSFRDRVNQDLIDLDRLRCFDIDVKELLTDCPQWITRIEMKLDGLSSTDNVLSKNRSFDLTARYKIKITIPYCRGFDYINGIKVYLNDNLIYEKTDGIIPEEG